MVFINNNNNVPIEDYNEAIKLYTDNIFKNMFDYLEYYNNCDVIPIVEAIHKMFEFYRAKNLDMFKDAISLPGLAYKMLINCPNANFSLFEEEDKHLYYMLKIIFVVVHLLFLIDIKKLIKL